MHDHYGFTKSDDALQIKLLCWILYFTLQYTDSDKQHFQPVLSWHDFHTIWGKEEYQCWTVVADKF